MKLLSRKVYQVHQVAKEILTDLAFDFIDFTNLKDLSEPQHLMKVLGRQGERA